MRQWLLVQLEPLDADRRNQLAEVLSPEWLSLGYNGLYTFIPWDILPGGDGPTNAPISMRMRSLPLSSRTGCFR